MEIVNLKLNNFRNFSQIKIEFDPKLTVILGPNGSGKSNILEAISLICGIRPSHVETDLDLVSFGKSEARIESRVKSQESSKTLAINFQVIDERFIKKSYLIDGFKKRFASFLEILSIVVFHPQDLDLVSGSPSLRRHHLDSFLSVCDRDYWRNLSAYNKVVVRRNKVLTRIAEGKSKPIELNFWDQRIIEHSKYITKKREEFIEFLNLLESADSFTPGVSKVDAGHTPGVFFSGLRFDLKQSAIDVEKILKNRDRDIAAGVTLSGPHRDDFRFKFKNRDLAYFGSRGEQRMAVLALKLSELEYLRVQKGTRPILALDDIFSELDWEHRQQVLKVVGNQQTIITAAEAESVPKNLLKKARVAKL